MLDASSPILLSLAAALILTALTLVMLYPTTLLRWLQRKRYQYEVTFSLYMLTPTEKFIFSTWHGPRQFPLPRPTSSTSVSRLPPLRPKLARPAHAGPLGFTTD